MSWRTRSSSDTCGVGVGSGASPARPAAYCMVADGIFVLALFGLIWSRWSLPKVRSRSSAIFLSCSAFMSST